MEMTDTEITIDPSNLALTDDIPIPTIGDNSDTNTVEYTDLADIIRHALLNIKTGQQKIFRPQRHERNHKFPCPICDKNCNENQQSIWGVIIFSSRGGGGVWQKRDERLLNF